MLGENVVMKNVCHSTKKEEASDRNFSTRLAQGAVRLCSGEVSVITAPHKEKLIKPSHSNHGSAKPLS